jgi:hypothetical protein
MVPSGAGEKERCFACDLPVFEAMMWSARRRVLCDASLFTAHSKLIVSTAVTLFANGLNALEAISSEGQLCSQFIPQLWLSCIC